MQKSFSLFLYVYSYIPNKGSFHIKRKSSFNHHKHFLSDIDMYMHVRSCGVKTQHDRNDKQYCEPRDWAATHWGGAKESSEEPRRFIGQVGKDYPAAQQQQRPTPLERQWAEMRFGLSSILLFLLLVSLFLSLSLLAIPSLLLLYLSIMKNAHWGSALVNGIGLISNLMALYAANFVYENPYATGFGGHFQVGGGLAVYECGMKTTSSLIHCFTYHCCCI